MGSAKNACKSVKISLQQFKMFCIAAFLSGYSAAANAANNDLAGKLEGIGNDFASYVKPVQKIVYAIAGICALVGAFTIYFKMSNGDQDVKKTIMLTVGGCVAMIALATALPSMFGVSASDSVTFTT